MQINVIEYFEKGALRTSKDKIAVREQGRDHTFGEIERFAKNCAALILKLVAGLNQPILFFLTKSAQNIVEDIGILYSGNAYANLDIKSPPQRLKGMLQNLNAPIIITSSAYVATLKALDISKDKLLLIEQATLPEAIFDNSLLLRRLESIIDTYPYCIIHTSVSTGLPK